MLLEVSALNVAVWLTVGVCGPVPAGVVMVSTVPASVTVAVTVATPVLITVQVWMMEGAVTVGGSSVPVAIGSSVIMLNDVGVVVVVLGEGSTEFSTEITTVDMLVVR